MAIIDIPQGSNPFATVSFTAESGIVFNIPADMVGNIVTNGATDFTVNTPGDLTGRTTDNLSNIQFGDGSIVAVNIPAGVDTSPYAIDANGTSMTPNIGDGATVRDMGRTGLDDGGTFAANENLAGNAGGSAGGSAEMAFCHDARSALATSPASGNQAFSGALTARPFRFLVTKGAASARDQHVGGSVFHSGLRAEVAPWPVSPAATK